MQHLHSTGVILDIVPSDNCMQFQGKRIIEIQEMDEKPHFGPHLGPLGLNSGHKSFLKNLASSVSVTTYHG